MTDEDGPPERRSGVRARRDSWLGRLERRLLAVLGPAAVSPVGRQPQRSATRTAGVHGRWAVRRDASGTTYLQALPAEPPAPDDAAPPTDRR